MAVGVVVAGEVAGAAVLWNSACTLSFLVLLGVDVLAGGVLALVLGVLAGAEGVGATILTPFGLGGAGAALGAGGSGFFSTGDSIEPKLIELVGRCPVPATLAAGFTGGGGWVSVDWRRDWTGDEAGALLAGDWARDVFDAVCGGPFAHAEFTGGTDGFDALLCAGGLTELLIE